MVFYLNNSTFWFLESGINVSNFWKFSFFLGLTSYLEGWGKKSVHFTLIIHNFHNFIILYSPRSFFYVFKCFMILTLIINHSWQQTGICKCRQFINIFVLIPDPSCRRGSFTNICLHIVRHNWYWLLVTNVLTNKQITYLGSGGWGRRHF